MAFEIPSLEDVKAAIADALKAAWEGISASVAEIAASAAVAVAEGVVFAGESLAGPLWALVGVAAGGPPVLSTAISALGGALAGPLLGIADNVLWVAAAVPAVAVAAYDVGALLGQALIALPQAFWAGIEPAAQAILQALVGVLPWVLGVLGYAVQPAVVQWVSAYLAGRALFITYAPMLYQSIYAYEVHLARAYVGPAFSFFAGESESMGPLDPVLREGHELMDKLVEGVWRFLLPSEKLGPEDAKARVAGFFKLVFTLNYLGSLLGELEVLWRRGFDKATSLLLTAAGGGRGGPGGAVADVVRNLYWSLGLCWLTWAALGDIVRTTISEPVERYVLSRYTPRLLTPSETREAFLRGYLTAEEYYRRMRLHGYSEEEAELYLHVGERELTTSVVRALWEEGLWNLADVERALRRLGFAGENLGWMVAYVVFSALREERRALASRLLDLVERGYRGPGWAEPLLRGLLGNEQVVDLLLAAAEAALEARLAAQEADAWLDLYERGKVARDEALQALLRLGVPREVAERWLSVRELRARLRAREGGGGG